jgi:hypothetical protein
MPMLYVEGEKTFIRLQEEIMKHSDDRTLFAWSRNDSSCRGLLADSRFNFHDCNNVIRSRVKLNRPPYSVVARAETAVQKGLNDFMNFGIRDPYEHQKYNFKIEIAMSHES